VWEESVDDPRLASGGLLVWQLKELADSQLCREKEKEKERPSRFLDVGAGVMKVERDGWRTLVGS
jgi:hypothetical protein